MLPFSILCICCSPSLGGLVSMRCSCLEGLVSMCGSCLEGLVSMRCPCLEGLVSMCGPSLGRLVSMRGPCFDGPNHSHMYYIIEKVQPKENHSLSVEIVSFLSE